MRMQLRLRKTLAIWALISVVVVVVCTVVVLDASITPAQRIEPYQQSGLFP